MILELTGVQEFTTYVFILYFVMRILLYCIILFAFYYKFYEHFRAMVAGEKVEINELRWIFCSAFLSISLFSCPSVTYFYKFTLLSNTFFSLFNSRNVLSIFLKLSGQFHPNISENSKSFLWET